MEDAEEAEEAARGLGGEGMSASRRGIGDGEPAAARANLTTASSQRPPNFRRQFRTPQAIRSDLQVENSQVQPNRFNVEGDTESTASSPQPPLPRGRGCSSLPYIPRAEPELRFPTPDGARNGAVDRVPPASGEQRPSRSTSAKRSPVKVQKTMKVKRRSYKTTSDVWEYFTQEETEDGPVAICGFCNQVYQCDRGYHGTSTLRSHLLYRCPSCPFTEKRRRLSLQDDKRFSAEACRRALVVHLRELGAFECGET